MAEGRMEAHPWREMEVTLEAARAYANGYTDVEVWVEFAHDSGVTLRRPAFWDGGRTWKVRFASPLVSGQWSWRTFSSQDDTGLSGQAGAIVCAGGPALEHRFYRHGFWRISPGKRNLVHADGRAALLVADTPWGLPWRATHAECEVYARDRQAKGFNAALLMSVQPDMDARGPRDRGADEGFDVGFEDLPTGHINQLNPAYFQYLDGLIDILVAHEIVPVYQPVFFGFGWKGLRVAGPVLPPVEYARYCRYLVARYGARPAIYLVGGDGSGREPQVAAGGEEVERWDAYGQPAGIHYRPHIVADAHQAAPWLDFQWCQTGHNGEHVPERVADLWRNQPPKGVANGEPSYEHIGKIGRAAGWWQGHEAWCNLCAGGTFGVVYGAGSLWEWAHHGDEAGFADFFMAPGCGWREALDFEGATYVGLVGRILDGLPLADIAPDWEVTYGRRGLLIPGKLFIAYAAEGGPLPIISADVPLPYRVIDPRTGEVLRADARASAVEAIPDEGGGPRVYICWDETALEDEPISLEEIDEIVHEVRRQRRGGGSSR